MHLYWEQHHCKQFLSGIERLWILQRKAYKAETFWFPFRAWEAVVPLRYSIYVCCEFMSCLSLFLLKGIASNPPSLMVRFSGKKLSLFTTKISFMRLRQGIIDLRHNSWSHDVNQSFFFHHHPWFRFPEVDPSSFATTHGRLCSVLWIFMNPPAHSWWDSFLHSPSPSLPSSLSLLFSPLLPSPSSPLFIYPHYPLANHPIPFSPLSTLLFH